MNIPLTTFAPEGTMRDVIALYTSQVRPRTQSYKVQEGVDSDLERTDFMFADPKAARAFIASLYTQGWSFIGDASVSNGCNLRVCVVLDLF